MSIELKQAIEEIWHKSREELTPAEKAKLTMMKNFCKEYDIEVLSKIAAMSWFCGNKSIARVLNQHETKQ